jgi:hypothetical protein
MTKMEDAPINSKYLDLHPVSNSCESRGDMLRENSSKNMAVMASSSRSGRLRISDIDQN